MTTATRTKPKAKAKAKTTIVATYRSDGLIRGPLISDTLQALTAAPAEGLSRNDIASALDVEPSSITPVIKQLKESGQIEQLGAARGANYRLSEQGREAVDRQAGEDG
ncbi:hypothetical protein KBY58_04490 [Cyanobium sp. HWJ4-Hawea]|uniref:hypothetical protein n=1 Tax=Cyanobium sp. HWJ4-Hawea TaxID=2823713 RepID=UPI0020CCE982|nr:hypothetical protein [Cyanobium sp. HWJ4-Hawea]MCP9808688.1 hypothetical protein [Cyanobium sp. HWJ4-Hawea]